MNNITPTIYQSNSSLQGFDLTPTGIAYLLISIALAFGASAFLIYTGFKRKKLTRIDKSILAFMGIGSIIFPIYDYVTKEKEETKSV